MKPRPAYAEYNAVQVVRIWLVTGEHKDFETLSDADLWLDDQGLCTEDVVDWNVVWQGLGEDTYEHRIAPTY